MLMDKFKIGQKIKEYRKLHKLSQAELAEMVGLSDKHIGRIEAGKYVPSCINFLKILEVLQINLSEFESTSAKKQKSCISEIMDLLHSSTESDIKLYLAILKVLKNKGN